MQRTEHMFNTSEQVSGYLDEAWRIVADSVVPLDCRAAVLPEVLKLIAGKQITFEQVSPVGIVAPGLGSH